MNETITPEKLILYIYNETGITDTVTVQNAIDSDPVVEMEFEGMLAASRLIDNVQMHASGRSIESILSYAQITAALR